MQTQNQDVFNFTDKIRESVTLGHSELLSLETELSGLANGTGNSVHKMSQILAILSRKISQRINATASSASNLELYISQMTMFYADMLSLVHSHTLLASFLHIQDSCDSKRIPHAFVSPNVLRNSLNKVRVKLQEYGRTLAISEDEIDLYYRLPIVQCTQGPSLTLVKVNVPYIMTDSRWKIARTYPVPYRFGDSTLYLDLPTQYVARNGEDVRIFESADENKCGGMYEFLCLLPIHTAAHIKNRQCLITLLGSPTVAEVQKVCEYTQINTTKPHVTSLPDGVFSIAHVPRGATIQCIRRTTKTSDVINTIPTFGNLELKLPCACSLTAAGSLLASNRFPCASGLVDEPELRTVVPAEWMLTNTEFPHPVQGGISLAMPNLTEEIMPLVRQLDSGAPRYINITGQSELEFRDDEMTQLSWGYKIRNWFGRSFAWTSFLQWLVIGSDTILIMILMKDYSDRLNAVAAVAVASKAVENIPMTAAQPLRAPSLSVCVMPENLESTLYMILLCVILLVIPKIWKWSRDVFGCCIRCNFIRKLCRSGRRSPTRGPKFRAPLDEEFEYVDDLSNHVFNIRPASVIVDAPVFNRLEEEIPRGQPVTRAASFANKPRGAAPRPPLTEKSS